MGRCKKLSGISNVYYIGNALELSKTIILLSDIDSAIHKRSDFFHKIFGHCNILFSRDAAIICFVNMDRANCNRFNRAVGKCSHRITF